MLLRLRVDEAKNQVLAVIMGAPTQQQQHPKEVEAGQFKPKRPSR